MAISRQKETRSRDYDLLLSNAFIIKYNTIVQRQTAVTVYFSSEQLLLFAKWFVEDSRKK